jgi:ABC-type lipoprotein export system ATPase subunit
VTAALVELAGVSKDYGALRPLRVEHLSVGEGEHVALVGLDLPAGETLINLITGATLPDHGHVRLFGRPTDEITHASDWLSTLDRFGIVSDRAALLEALTVVQNLALPFSLEIEPPNEEIRHRAIQLAREVEIEEALWDARTADLEGSTRLRVRLGRALALEPSLLLVEHPTAAVAAADILDLGQTVRKVAERRRIAAVILTADRRFAAVAASRVLTFAPATGRFRQGGW